VRINEENCLPSVRLLMPTSLYRNTPRLLARMDAITHGYDFRLVVYSGAFIHFTLHDTNWSILNVPNQNRTEMVTT